MRAALSSTFRSPWNETVMFQLMLQTSLQHLAGGVLAVLTRWHFAPVRARVSSSHVCAGRRGGGRLGSQQVNGGAASRGYPAYGRS